MINFTTIFEIPKPIDWNFCAGGVAGLVVLILGIVMLAVRKRNQGRWPKKSGTPLFSILVGGIIFITTVLVLTGSIYERKKLVSIYKSGLYQVSEGIVNVLHRQPRSGHTKGDIISINGQKLEINYYIKTEGYSRTISHGGSLREGVYAKVYHYKGKILRVDIRN